MFKNTCAVALGVACTMAGVASANNFGSYLSYSQIKTAMVAGVLKNQYFYVGIYDMTWVDSITFPNTTNMMHKFSGYSDPDLALLVSGDQTGSLFENWLVLGGGNANGAFSTATIEKIAMNAQRYVNNGYHGVSIDLEECHGTLDAGQFDIMFKTLKDLNLKTMLTIPHTGPYACGDSYDLMAALLKSKNIDVISHQYYTLGNEPQPEFSQASYCPWSMYKTESEGGERPDDSNIIFWPSVAYASHVEAVNEFQKTELGIAGTTGYIQWNNYRSVTYDGVNQPSTLYDVKNFTKRCGTDWSTANADCLSMKFCSLDTDCLIEGESCMADMEIDNCRAEFGLFPEVETVDKPKQEDLTDMTMRCGKDYKSAIANCDVLCLDDTYCGEGEKCYIELEEQCDITANITDYGTRCGASFAAAAAVCGEICTTNGDCSEGESCWTDLPHDVCGVNGRFGNDAVSTSVSFMVLLIASLAAFLQ